MKAYNILPEIQELIKDYGWIQNGSYNHMRGASGTEVVVQMEIFLSPPSPATPMTPREIRSELYLQAESIISLLESKFSFAEMPRIIIEGSGRIMDTQGFLTLSFLGR
jgi:hypothetical protein